MTFKKSTPTILRQFSEVKDGQYIIANSGDVVEVCPKVRKILPKNYMVRTFEV